jgi:hypothetical protein
MMNGSIINIFCCRHLIWENIFFGWEIASFLLCDNDDSVDTEPKLNGSTSKWDRQGDIIHGP